MDVAIDVTNIDSIKEAYDAVLRKYKTPPSVIVNSAGIAYESLVSDLNAEELDNILNVNLKVRNFLIICIIYATYTNMSKPNEMVGGNNRQKNIE